MRTRSFVVLGIAALLSLPTFALSKEHERGGGRSGRHSSGSVHARGDRHDGGQRARSNWSGSRSRDRGFARNIEAQRDRGTRWREGASRERSSIRDWADRAWSRGGERVYRTPGPGRIERSDRDAVRRLARGDGDRRYTRRDGGHARGSGDYRYRDGGRTYAYRDGGHTRYKPSGPIIHRGGGHRARHYYTGGYYRPSYIARSGFFLGFTISTFPSYGYRYWDPYCGIYFSSLDPYYAHCHGHVHPSAILVIDYRSHAPIATCIYDSGAWVVDDCAHGGYAYDPYDDDLGYDDGGYCEEY